ncbi:MAG: D-2-hydroxyacid dehydrogenase [Lacunisphaera sp.]|nr:D-2-hydroxyacid dehydrogenase [Lacunisphaera sp.]
MKLLLNTVFKFSEAHRALLQAACPGLELVEQNAGTVEQLDGSDVDILVTEPVPRNLEAWGRLRWVQLLSAGSNQLAGHPIRATALPVTTASGTHGVPIAQYVTCAVLMLAHSMPQVLQYKETQKWPNRLALAGRLLRGQKVGIIGYGSIGRECARQLSALGMNVLCLKRDPKAHRDDGYNVWPGTGDPEGQIPAGWFGPAQLAEFLPQCDFVVVTVPSTLQTEGMLGRAQLALLKRSAHLIIISRGGIVPEPVLAEALRSGVLAGAAVDCYVKEPLNGPHEFFSTPNLIMTPHMSGVYDGFWDLMVGLIAENLRRFCAGAPLLNPVNHRYGY